MAAVGPARLRRTRQSLEEHASAVRSLLEQAEKAESELRLSLEAAEALLARLQGFRVAEVKNECTAYIDFTRQHASQCFSVVLKVNEGMYVLRASTLFPCSHVLFAGQTRQGVCPG